MDRSYPYTRRLAQRTRLHKRFAAVAAIGVAGCAVLYAVTAQPQGRARDEASAAPRLALAAPAQAGAAAAQALKPGQRRIYPYSIVPGGVSGARELGRVIREDKVVAAHYAEFDMAKAHEKTVTAPRAVHVSYRKGDKVYWTAKKVMLAEGETLLSDGTHEARARCANQISDTPRFPVEAHGPSAEELDSSVVETGAEDSFENVSAGMLDGEGVPGGFLNAPGSGSAGGILAGGAAQESASLFAAAANVPGPAGGALLSSRSGSSRAAPGRTGNASPDGGSNGSNGGDSGGTPAASLPSAGAPDSGGSTPAAPAPKPARPQPSVPAGPDGGTDPANPVPALPSGPETSLPVTPVAPVPPGGGQSGGGGNGTPSRPSTELGGIPSLGGPNSSPVPEPTLDGPRDPVQPGQPPAKAVEVPEPGTGWLVGAVLALMLVLRRRNRRG